MAERTLVGSYHRKTPEGGMKLMRTAYYSRIDTAIPRAMGKLLQECEPGDTFELAHRSFGFQIATIRVHAGGKIAVAIAPD